MPVKGVSAFSVSPVGDGLCSIADANGAGLDPGRTRNLHYELIWFYVWHALLRRRKLLEP